MILEPSSGLDEYFWGVLRDGNGAGSPGERESLFYSLLASFGLLDLLCYLRNDLKPMKRNDKKKAGATWANGTTLNDPKSTKTDASNRGNWSFLETILGQWRFESVPKRVEVLMLGECFRKAGQNEALAVVFWSTLLRMRGKPVKL